MSWEVRLGGQCGDADAELALMTALSEWANSVGDVGFSSARTDYLGEGDLATVANGNGARSPGEAAAWAEAQANQAAQASTSKASTSTSKSSGSSN